MHYRIFSSSRETEYCIFEDLVSKIQNYELSAVKDVLQKELISYLKKAEAVEVKADDEGVDAFIVQDNNYGKVLEVYCIVSYWNDLKENAGYEIEILDIHSELEGYILTFELDTSKLSKNQIYYAIQMIHDENAFEVFKNM